MLKALTSGFGIGSLIILLCLTNWLSSNITALQSEECDSAKTENTLSRLIGRFLMGNNVLTPKPGIYGGGWITVITGMRAMHLLRLHCAAHHLYGAWW